MTLTLLGHGIILAEDPHPQDAPQRNDELDGAPVPVRTLPPAALVAPSGMSRWPRFDRYTRALSVATSRAVVSADADLGIAAGLYVTSEYSCYETNADFHRGLIDKGPRLASPLLFPYTLPGAAAAEVAMHFRLGGEHLVFAGGASAALASLLSAADSLAGQDGRALVVASADVLGVECLRARVTGGQFEPEVALSEAASALVVQAENDPACPCFAIDGAFGPASPDANAWMSVTTAALDRSGIAPAALARIYSATIPAAARQTELAVARHLARGVPVTQGCLVHGDCGATLGLLAVLAACAAAGPTLILATSRAATIAVVMAPQKPSNMP